MKEIKLVFAPAEDMQAENSFELYVDGVHQERVRSVDIHAENLYGDMLRNLIHSVNLDAIATYTVEHYVDVYDT